MELTVKHRIERPGQLDEYVASGPFTRHSEKAAAERPERDWETPMPLRIPGADVLPSIGVAMPTSREQSAGVH